MALQINIAYGVEGGMRKFAGILRKRPKTFGQDCGYLLLVICPRLEMGPKVLMRHEFGLFPWSLATSDGSLVQTKKTTLSYFLEDRAECFTSLSPVMAQQLSSY